MKMKESCNTKSIKMFQRKAESPDSCRQPVAMSEVSSDEVMVPFWLDRKSLMNLIRLRAGHLLAAKGFDDGTIQCSVEGTLMTRKAVATFL